MDIVSVDASSPCPETHPERFLSDVWPGTAPGCLCAGENGGTQLFFGEDCTEEYDETQVNVISARCKPIDAVPEIVQDVIMGVRFCARTAGKYKDSFTSPFKVDCTGEGTVDDVEHCYACEENKQSCRLLIGEDEAVQ